MPTKSDNSQDDRDRKDTLDVNRSAHTSRQVRGGSTSPIDLPEVAKPALSDEQSSAVLDDVPVDPAFVPSPTEPTTTSVEIVASRVLTGASFPAAAGTSGQHSGSSTVRRERSGTQRAGTVSHPTGGGGRPESSTLLTADRLLDAERRPRHPPEGGWSKTVYNLTFGAVNLGDSAVVRARKELDSRIRTPLSGSARFVPVLSRKGGVGKTTVTTLLGMALASYREDRVIAIDANPDRGTLSDRFTEHPVATIREVASKPSGIDGFTDFSSLVTRDATRLDVLASNSEPTRADAFTQRDYEMVADIVSRFYSIVLTDCGTGIVDPVMKATLQRADMAVIVSGGSVDEVRLASETLSWLEVNGFADLARNSVVAFNTATQGTNMVKIHEVESHFRSRVREIVRIPYDRQLAAGAMVSWDELQPLTRYSARSLAALVVEGLVVS